MIRLTLGDAAAARGAPRPAEPERDERTRIVGLLGPAPVSIDDLVRMSQSTPAVVRTVLLELEIVGRWSGTAARWFRSRHPPRQILTRDFVPRS